jgi:hypothetical protein
MMNIRFPPAGTLINISSEINSNPFCHSKQPLRKKDLELSVHGTYFVVQSAFYQRIKLTDAAVGFGSLYYKIPCDYTILNNNC